MAIELTHNNSKAVIRIEGDSKGVINDIRSLHMLKKNIKMDKDKMMCVDINAKLKIDLDNETLTVLF